MAEQVEDPVPPAAVSANESKEEAAAENDEGAKEEPATENNGESKESQNGKNSRDSKADFKRRDFRTEFKQNRKNVKTDYDALSETDDADEIRKQVEFYFSDSNLVYDDHMRSLVLGNSEDKYGANKSVPIKTIHNFKRMRRFQPYSAVVKALKESKTLDVVGDQDDEIRRKVPFEKPETKDGDFNDPTIPRSIYAKGFGEEGRTTQFDIEAFFTPYGPINSVRLRRTFPERHFKGSVFVEFESEELQKEFLDLESKPKFQGHELLIMSKQEYCDKKMDDIKSGKIHPNSRGMQFRYYYKENPSDNRNRDRGGNRGQSKGRGRGGSGGRDRRDRDRDDWRGRRDDFQKNGFHERRRRRDKEEDEDDSDGAPRRKSPVVESEGAQEGADSPAKKRSREDDTEEASAAKKTKPDEAVEAT